MPFDPPVGCAAWIPPASTLQFLAFTVRPSHSFHALTFPASCSRSSVSLCSPSAPPPSHLQHSASGRFHPVSHLLHADCRTRRCIAASALLILQMCCAAGSCLASAATRRRRVAVTFACTLPRPTRLHVHVGGAFDSDCVRVLQGSLQRGATMHQQGDGAAVCRQDRGRGPVHLQSWTQYRG